MNSVQLSQRLGRKLNVPDAAFLPADAALDVLQAANAGIERFYAEMPSIYRRTPMSVTLRAAQNLSVIFSAKYAKTITTNAFSAAMLGCTFRASNADNEITSQNSVRDDWLSDTLSVNGQVFGDAVQIGENIERITSEVRLSGATMQTPLALIRNESLRRGVLIQNSAGVPSTSYLSFLDRRSIGRPRFYFMDAAGESTGSTPKFILRVAPLPDADYTLRFDAELAPTLLTFSQLNTAVNLPVRASLVESALLPLCEAALTESAYWKDKSQIRRVLDKAEAIIARELPRVAHDMAVPQNMVGSPPGF